MRTFRSDSENDGLITIFPTVLIRQQDDWFSIGFWWGMWAIDFGWWERKTIQTLKIIITPFLGILALISLVSFIALLIFAYGVWRVCDWWVKPRLIVPCA